MIQHSLRFVGLFLLAICSLAFPHATGTSKVAVRLIDPDSVTVEVNANTEELVNATHSTADTGSAMEKSRLFQERTESYLISRVNLTVNGRPVDNMRVVRWKLHGAGREDDFVHDTNLIMTSPSIITLGGSLPKERRVLKVTVNLWPELGVQAISEVSFFWRDSLLDRRWIKMDSPLRFEISPDSLAAALERTKHVEARANPAGTNLFARFIGLGYTHILPLGMDHILFVLGLFFFATVMRPLLIQITAFTVAHSITLGLSMLGIFSLPSRIVEPLIALSIAVVGIENIFSKKLRPSRWMVVFGFGLIHGMGFAGALKELGLPPGRFWSTLAGFNIGVELGQLTVVSIAFALTYWMWKKPWYRAWVVIPASVLISVVALYWFAQRTLGF